MRDTYRRSTFIAADSPSACTWRILHPRPGPLPSRRYRSSRLVVPSLIAGRDVARAGRHEVEERARRLRLVPDEYDQVLRLDRFRQDYPAIVVGAGNGWWQAVIPAPDGEIVTTRYTLRALLDKLDELINANPGHE